MCHELKSRLGSDDRMSTEDGEPCSNLPSKQNSLRVRCRGQARRHLSFAEEEEEEEDSIRKMAPSTPKDLKGACSSIIHIEDSDDEPDASDEKGKAPETSSESKSNDHRLEDDVDVCNGSTPCAFTPKRKRAANAVISDSESDDDNLTVSQFMEKHLAKASSDANGLSMTTPSPSASDYNDDEDGRVAATLRWKRLRRNFDATNIGTKHEQGISETMGDADAAEEEEGSDVSGDSIGEVEGSDVSGDSIEEEEGSDVDSEEEGSDGESEEEGPDVPGDSIEREEGSHVDAEEEGSDVASDCMREFIVESTDNVDVPECDREMEKIKSWLSRRRNEDGEFNWTLSGEMLRDLGDDDELCMSAVCALYRRQTDSEQDTKSTVERNYKGFSQPDAYIGSKMAAFLIGPLGGVSKSVEELRAYNPEGDEFFDGVEKCRDLAMKYSEQLFDIYKNKEDRFFPPTLDNK